MIEFFTSLWAIVLDMAPYLLLGFFIAGLLYAFVPQTLIAKHMARPGFRSVLNSTLLGIPLPLCSCGVIPTTVGLRRTGASRGACTSFLISTPQTGVDSILATYSVLGLPFAIVRPVAALVTGVFGGMATDKLMKDENELKETGDSSNSKLSKNSSETADSCNCDDDDDCSCGCGCGCHDHSDEAHSQSLIGKLKIAFDYAFGELLEDVGKWLAVGLLIAAIITVAVPDNFFDALKDYPFVNMLIVLAIAIPMYVCATGSIPIALSLMMKGLTPGAALVLLMAGPAINSASMLVINKAFGKKQMIIYITSIIIGAILFGLGIDYLLPSEWFAVTATNAVDACCEGEDHGSWFSIVCSILFLALLARALFNTYFGHHHHHHDNEVAENAEECTNGSAENKVTMIIEGMNCSHCAKNAQNAIASVPGVKAVEVDHVTKTAVITAEEGCSLDIEAITKVVEDAGYEIAK